MGSAAATVRATVAEVALKQEAEEGELAAAWLAAAEREMAMGATGQVAAVAEVPG